MRGPQAVSGGGHASGSHAGLFVVYALLDPASASANVRSVVRDRIEAALQAGLISLLQARTSLCDLHGFPEGLHRRKAA